MPSDPAPGTAPGTAPGIAPGACIMVALDGSPAAEAVLPHAATLSRVMSSALHLVRVVAPRGTRQPAQPHRSHDTELREAEEYLGSVCRRLAGEGLEIECEVMEGDPALTLIRYAEENASTALIAMTTHGRSGRGQWPLGSVADKVLRATDKPILMVRPENGIWIPPLRTYQVVLVPLDGSPPAEQALDRATALALGTGATLLLVSVVPPPDDFGASPAESRLPAGMSAWQAELDAISCYLQRTAFELSEQTPGLPVEIRVVAGRPADAILSVSEQAHAGLIVMSTHGGGGPQQDWPGSIALKVVQCAHTPVLLVRAGSPTDTKQRAEKRGLQDLPATHP